MVELVECGAIIFETKRKFMCNTEERIEGNEGAMLIDAKNAQCMDRQILCQWCCNEFTNYEFSLADHECTLLIQSPFSLETHLTWTSGPVVPLAFHRTSSFAVYSQARNADAAQTSKCPAPMDNVTSSRSYEKPAM